MSPTVIIVMVCSLVAFIFATALVFDRRYKDGWAMRIALSILAVAAYIRFTAIVFEGELYVTPVATLIWIGNALFFACHYLRFRHFASKAPKAGERRKQFGAAK